MGLSGLNQQRKSYHLIDYGHCESCNARSEDPAYYFLVCPNFATHKIQMLQDIQSNLPELNIICGTQKQRRILTSNLYNGLGSFNADVLLFQFEGNFIMNSKRL